MKRKGRAARPRSGVVTFTTDFGTADGYAGAMKGVVLRIAPAACVVNITHEIRAHDVLAAAAALETAFPFFPEGTVHVAVVDPGVGSARRPIAIEAGGHLFVGPDNGIFTPVLAAGGGGASRGRVVELADPRFRLTRVSQTFHGRDLFAPAAAHLAVGVGIEALGPVVGDPVVLDPPAPKGARGAEIEGEVIHVDSFGNLVTNIREADLAALGTPEVTVRAGRRTVRGLCVSYAAVAEGEPLAIIGGSARLEISVNRGRADEVLGIGRGGRVRVRPANRKGT